MRSKVPGLLLSLMLAPAAAHAQTVMSGAFVSPYFGVTAAGGDAAANGAPSVGAAAGWKGSKWWGFEADVAYTPGFFEQDDFLTERRVTTVMGSLLVGKPMSAERRISFYGAGGFGLVRARLSDAGGLNDLEVSQPGFNIGGGLAWMKNSIGVRGDVRYLRSLGDEADDDNLFGIEISSLDFVRVSAGLMVTF
jgi:Outer membrane protein beta-barrel domain